jgi:hypothetical protein
MNKFYFYNNNYNNKNLSSFSPRPSTRPLLKIEQDTAPTQTPTQTPTPTPTETQTPATSNDIGFIILRHVNNAKTNEYWKECYRCIRNFYPLNKILIIDDNSNKVFLKEDDHNPFELTNTTTIYSEYPKRGELLPYYYYLKNKFCDIAVILHDSVFIQRPMNFYVDEYKMLWHFKSYMMKDTQSSGKQIEQIKALNNQDLSYMYKYFYLDKFNGCFGAMSIIRHSYLIEVNNIFKIDKLIPHITSRVARCAFERIVSFLLIYKNYTSGFYYKNKNKHQSLLGDIEKYCRWGITYDEYIKYKHKINLPIIKVWTGR